MTGANLLYIFLCVGIVLASPNGILVSVSNVPDHVTVEEGETAILPCEVKNLGSKIVVWRKSAQDYPLTIGRYSYTTNINIKSHDRLNWDLRIDNVTISDSGVYTCGISSTHVISGSVTLEVIPRKVEATSLPAVEVTSLPAVEATSLPAVEAASFPDGHNQSTSPSSKITDEMLRSAQLEYYRDEILTNKKIRQVLGIEQKLLETMTKFMKEKNLSLESKPSV